MTARWWHFPCWSLVLFPYSPLVSSLNNLFPLEFNHFPTFPKYVPQFLFSQVATLLPNGFYHHGHLQHIVCVLYLLLSSRTDPAFPVHANMPYCIIYVAYILHTIYVFCFPCCCPMLLFFLVISICLFVGTRIMFLRTHFLLIYFKECILKLLHHPAKSVLVLLIRYLNKSTVGRNPILTCMAGCILYGWNIIQLNNLLYLIFS